MVGGVHNPRILRFLVVLSIVVLTIFVYASYSTNSATYSPSPHPRNAAAIVMLPPQSAEALRSNNHQNRTSYIGDNIDGNANSLDNSDASNAGIGIRAVASDPNELVKYAKPNIKSPSSASNEGVNFAKKQLPQPQPQQQQQQQKVHHREPTIDVDAVGEGGGGIDEVPDDLLEEQYVQNVDNTLGNINNLNVSLFGQQQPQTMNSQNQLVGNLNNIRNNNNDNNINNNNNNNSNNNNNNLNKILDSEVLIPTSNLQKFIENADKILKNITVVNSSPPSDAIIAIGAGPDNNANSIQPHVQEKDTQSLKVETENKIDNIEENDEALPPSVIMTIKRPGVSDIEEKPDVIVNPPSPKVKPVTPKAVANATIPHPVEVIAKGILTQDIYEPGHLNDEINIARVCPNKGADIKLLILITSAPSHDEARLAIRQTWGHYGTRRDVSTAFVLGRTLNKSLNLAMDQENFIYGDLIRGNFIDSYNNLTLKTVSSLEWVDQNCPSAKFILKTDDDMFINVPKLLSFIDSHSKEKRIIYGRLAKKWKPIRNKKSKYYVSVDQFAAPIYPPFTTGPAYVLSKDTIHDLYVRSLRQVYLKLEDVFTTGIIAQQLNIKRAHVNEFLNRRIAFNPCNIRKTISVHMIKANEQFDLWKKLLDQTTKCK